MKHGTLLVLAGMLLLLGAGTAFAVSTDQFDITVTVKWMDVSLKQSASHATDYTIWAVGAVDGGTVQTMPSTAAGHIWVVNGSNIPINLQGSVATAAPAGCGFGTPTAWTPGNPATADQFRLEIATGSGTAPTGTWTVINGTPAQFTSSTVAMSSGVDIFSRVTPPTTTTDGCLHTLTVTIYAVQ